MELHSLDGEFAMTQRHDFAVVALGRDFETGRKRVSLHDERMVSAGLKRRCKIDKQSAAVVLDHRRFTMHETRSADDLSAVRFRDALMAQTHAQDRNLTAETHDDVFADACFARRTRSRRNADVPRR